MRYRNKLATTEPNKPELPKETKPKETKREETEAEAAIRQIEEILARLPR